MKSFRTLRVFMNMALKWDEQFEKMKEKLINSIRKLINTKINSYQAHIYFNMYIIRSIYFRYGIFKLIEVQDKALRLIYERLILKKLGLGEKFLRILVKPWTYEV